MSDEQRLDLSKYRTRELVEHLTELISVPAAILTVIMCCIAISSIAASFSAWLVWDDEIAKSIKAGIAFYSAICGAILGIGMGILRAFSRAIFNVEGVLRIILDTTLQAAHDYERLQSGSAIMPTSSQLIEQVHSEVISPAVEESVSAGLGVIGSPIVWMYRWTVRSAVNSLVRRVASRPVADDGYIANKTESGLRVVAKYSRRIERTVTVAGNFVAAISRNTRFVTLTPLYAVYLIAVLVACTPILLIHSYYS